MLGFLVFPLLWIGVALPSAAQNPSLPTDAKSLLAFHQEALLLGMQGRADEGETLRRAQVYRASGAESELRNEIRNLTEENSQALLHAMVADCWNPAHFEDGRQRASRWLDRFPEGSVKDRNLALQVREYLDAADRRRAELMQLRRNSFWLPLASMGGVALFAFVVARWMP